MNINGCSVFSRRRGGEMNTWETNPKGRLGEANTSRFPFIFFILSGFSILNVTSRKTKRSSFDSYGIKHCVKLVHYHTYATRPYVLTFANLVPNVARLEDQGRETLGWDFSLCHVHAVSKSCSCQYVIVFVSMFFDCSLSAMNIWEEILQFLERKWTESVEESSSKHIRECGSEWGGILLLSLFALAV